MTKTEALAALEGQKAIIASNQESLATIRLQREQLVEDLDRMKRGDDLRAILIDSAEGRLGRLDDVIKQTENQIRLMEGNLRHFRNALEG